MGRVQLDIYMQKNKSKKEETFLKKKENLPTGLIPFTKINLKWITGLHVRCKTINSLEGKIGEYVG